MLSFLLTLLYKLNQKNPNMHSFLDTEESKLEKFWEFCVSFPLCLLLPEFQGLQVLMTKCGIWYANLSPAILGWQYCELTTLITLIIFQIFIIRWDKPNLFFKEFKVGIIVSEGGNNGEMFVVAICNNLMLTESSILFSN